MRIAVYGATGMIGSRLVAEALRKGHRVVGITRSGGDLPAGASAVVGDAGDAATAKSVAADADVVVSAIGPVGTGEEFLAALRTLVENAGGTRLVVVGGAGSLLVNGQRLVDGPDFPAAWRPLALVQVNALELLRELDETVEWTYLSPAPVIEPGERTGSYRTGPDEPAGERISAEDFALALLDEIENPAHRGQRFTVAN